MKNHFVWPLLALAASGCMTKPEPAPIKGLPPVSVRAVGETIPVGTANADAADDPAIWRNAANPAASLIVATDKKAGLYIYGMDGKIRSFSNVGFVNNVDLIETKDHGVIVVASDRNDRANAKLAIFRLDTEKASFTPLAVVPSGKGEGYGVCLAPGSLSGGDANDLTVFAVHKDGTIGQLLLSIGNGKVAGKTVRTMKLATQTEGCVVDTVTNTLFVGEEDVGVWRFDAASTGATTGELVIPIDNQRMVADVEGLAVYDNGKQRWLIASSQGDNAYAVYSLPALNYAGRFEIAAGQSIGGAEETDGIAVASGAFGPGYPTGLFIAQDGFNQPGAQNFKLVSWADVVEALKLGQ